MFEIFETHSQYILYIALMSNIHTYILIYLQIFLFVLRYCRLLNKGGVFVVQLFFWFVVFGGFMFVLFCFKATEIGLSMAFQ